MFIFLIHHLTLWQRDIREVSCTPPEAPVSCCSLNRTIYTTSAKKGIVCCIHDCLHICYFCYVTFYRLNQIHCSIFLLYFAIYSIHFLECIKVCMILNPSCTFFPYPGIKAFLTAHLAFPVVLAFIDFFILGVLIPNFILIASVVT